MWYHRRKLPVDVQPLPTSTAVLPRGPAKRRVIRRRPFVLVVVVAAIAASYAARAPLLTTAARVLVVDTAAPGADFIVTLGGGAETRPFAAAELYRKGVASTVLIFENPRRKGSPPGLSPTAAELYRRVLEFEGVPPHAIRTVPGEVTTTWDEATALRQMLPATRPVTVVIVTSPEHTRRARWAFRRALAGTRVDIRMAPARRPDFDETNWWRDDGEVLAYLHEYLKLPFYWARYTFS